MKKHFGLLWAVFESFRSVQDDPIIFLAPAVTWAILTAGVAILFCLIVMPPGSNVPLGMVLLMFRAAPIPVLIELVLNFLGGTVLGLCLSQWKLLGSEGNNPFFGSREWPRYALYSLVVLALMIASIIPAILLGVLFFKSVPHTTEFRVIGGSLTLVLALTSMFYVNARLCMVLPAIARKERLSIGQSIQMTRGYSFKLSVGLFLTFIVPSAIFVLLSLLAQWLYLGSTETPGMIIWEILRNFEAIVVYGFVALFTSIAYDTLRSPAADELAKQFE